LKFSPTKGIFFGFEWEKTNITTFGPPGNILEKSPSAPPLQKILPTPVLLYQWSQNIFENINHAAINI